MHDLISTLPRRGFYFVRHGQTDYNAGRRVQGQLDIPLNPKGLNEAKEARRALSGVPITLIVSSPLSRALTTARIIAQDHDCPLRTDDRLMERAFGDFEGKTIEELAASYQLTRGEDIHGLIPPGGESFEEMTLRMLGGIGGILQETDGTVLIVGHGGLCLGFSRILDGARILCPNATPYRVHAADGDGQWRFTAVE